MTDGLDSRFNDSKETDHSFRDRMIPQTNHVDIDSNVTINSSGGIVWGGSTKNSERKGNIDGIDIRTDDVEHNDEGKVLTKSFE